jgi:GNAT superfamily N-acetyltransferase
MLKIKVMTAKDIPFAKGLTDYEQWGYRTEDFQRLLFFEPRGCFTAWLADERVGIVSATSYGRYGFIGTLIVRQEWKGSGFGVRLMERAIDFLHGRGVKTIELDGVFPVVPIYRKLGFKDKYLSLRLMRKPGTAGFSSCSDGHSRFIREIPGFDRRMTGIERDRMVRRYLSEFPDQVYAAGKGDLRAYAVARPRESGVYMIGPFVATGPKPAEAVLDRILADHGKDPLIIGIPANNRSAVELVQKYGFLNREPSLRMFLGVRKDYEKNVFGILSPEKG